MSFNNEMNFFSDDLTVHDIENIIKSSMSSARREDNNEETDNEEQDISHTFSDSNTRIEDEDVKVIDLVNSEIVQLDGAMKRQPDYEVEEKMELEEWHACGKDITETVTVTARSGSFYNRRPLWKNADTYELEKFDKHLLVIFNQVHVYSYEPRLGTDKDVLALTNTFGKYGFEINVQTDLTKAEIISVLDALVEKDFTDYGCVVVAVLTHGSNDGELRAKDKDVYTEKDIITRLKVNKNPTLITKPKIILIQACRGTDSLAGVHVAARQIVYHDSIDQEQYYTLPVESDMLVVHSSYAGKSSHRTINGSWFIQTLCNKIDVMAPREDLESILVHIKRAVAIDNEDEKFNRGRDMLETNKQMPVTTSTLIRKLYLREHEETFMDGPMETTVGNLNIGGSYSLPTSPVHEPSTDSYTPDLTPEGDSPTASLSRSNTFRWRKRLQQPILFHNQKRKPVPVVPVTDEQVEHRNLHVDPMFLVL